MEVITFEEKYLQKPKLGISQVWLWGLWEYRRNIRIKAQALPW